MKIAPLTGTDNYFEDFVVGAVYRHARGKTVEPLDNVLITNIVMNTASSHFDEHLMRDTLFGSRVVYGGVTISLIIGMATQDTGENALVELGLDALRLPKSVFHGDTLYAYTEVLSKQETDREDAGEIVFRHYGVNQNEAEVFRGERRVLMKKHSYWADR